jgi:hypothetical protein
MRADGDARAGTCGKLWAALRLKSADFSTFYRFQQLRSTAAEAIFHFSGSPICNAIDAGARIGKNLLTTSSVWRHQKN